MACNKTGLPAMIICRYAIYTAPNCVKPERGLAIHSLNPKVSESSPSPTDRHSYLEPTEPDDQEMDYDNIWEYDGETGMIQPTSGISTHRTGLDFGARGLGGMATQPRWS